MRTIIVTLLGFMLLTPSISAAATTIPYDPYNFLINTRQPFYIPGPITRPYGTNRSDYLYSNRPVGQASLTLHTQYDYPSTRYQTSYQPATGNRGYSYTSFGYDRNPYSNYDSNTYNAYQDYYYGNGSSYLNGSPYYGYRMLNYSAYPYGYNQQNYGYGY